MAHLPGRAQVEARQPFAGCKEHQQPRFIEKQAAEPATTTGEMFVLDVFMDVGGVVVHGRKPVCVFPKFERAFFLAVGKTLRANVVVDGRPAQRQRPKPERKFRPRPFRQRLKGMNLHK